MLAKIKVVLVGEEGVGKSSLIRRYVLDEFDEAYKSTLGVKVLKKDIAAKRPDGAEVQATTMVWDVMGAPTFRELLKEAYFHGTNGVLAVCDMTRPETLVALDAWVRAVRSVAAEAPVIVLGNQSDRKGEIKVRAKDLKAQADRTGSKFLLTSAKTGQNVEEAFRALVEVVIAKFGAS